METKALQLNVEDKGNPGKLQFLQRNDVCFADRCTSTQHQNFLLPISGGSYNVYKLNVNYVFCVYLSLSAFFLTSELTN